MILAESIALGLLCGFFFYEWLGLSAGGLVVPGYIALQLGNPVMVVCTLVVSLLTYVSVKALSCVTILYGRRRFILMVLAGFAWQSLFRLAVQQHFIAAEMDTVGFIIPGLIANEMERQRILPTLMAMVVVSILVRLALIAFGLLS